MKNKLPYISIAVLLIVYSSLFIWRTSFVVEGERFFILFDDAMISMNYARNLAQGEGLVMNPGERVEGITNPLWTVIMSAAHFIPLPLSKMSLVIQILGVLILLSMIPAIHRLSSLISPGRPWAHLTAVIFGIFYYPLLNWTLQGLEVGLLALMTLHVSIIAIESLKKKTTSPLLYPLLGLGTLVRFDFVIVYLAIWFGMMILERENLKKHLVHGAAFLFLFIGGQTIARFLYYQEWLPNTYYLKMDGYPLFYRLTRGSIVYLKFLYQFNPFLLILPIAAIFARPKNWKRLLLGIFVFQSAYSIWVGGDAWEEYCAANRYISTSIPLLFILFADSLDRFIRYCAEKLQNDRFLPQMRGFAVILCLLIVNTPGGGGDLPGLALLEKPFNVSLNRDMVSYALSVKKLTTPGARIGITWAGIIPYISERPIVDFLGKNDKVIARREMRGPGEDHNRFTHFLPGHLKWDYSHSIGWSKPDLIIQFWGDIEEAEPYILPHYKQVLVGTRFWYARAGSDKIRWGVQ